MKVKKAYSKLSITYVKTLITLNNSQIDIKIAKTLIGKLAKGMGRTLTEEQLWLFVNKQKSSLAAVTLKSNKWNKFISFLPFELANLKRDETN